MRIRVHCGWQDSHPLRKYISGYSASAEFYRVSATASFLQVLSSFVWMIKYVNKYLIELTIIYNISRRKALEFQIPNLNGIFRRYLTFEA